MEISLPWEGDESLKSPFLDKETGGQKRLVHEAQNGEIFYMMIWLNPDWLRPQLEFSEG